MEIIRLFKRRKPKHNANNDNARRLAKSIINDVMPKYSTLFEEERITPAEIRNAISEYRHEGKVQALSNVLDLFMDSDADLQSAVQVRKEALKACVWAYDDGFPKPKADFYDNLLKNNISGWVDIFIEGKLYGWHFLQIMWELVDGHYLPQELVGYTNLDLRIVNRKLQLFERDKPQELPEHKFINILYRRPHLHSILKYYIFYGVAINNWAEFAETYGKPLRLGKYDAGIDTQELQVLKQAVKNLGTDQSGIISKTTDIQFVDFAGKDTSASLYETLCRFTSDQVTKAILGQTLTTGHGTVGSLALGEVHNKVREDIQQADIRDFERFVNVLLSSVDAVNFGTGVNLWLTLPKSIDLAKRMDIDSKLVAIGLPMSEDYFYDTYDVDRPVKGQKVIERPVYPAFSQQSEKHQVKAPALITNSQKENMPIDINLAKLQSEIRSLPSYEALKNYRPRWFIAELGQSLGRNAVEAYIDGRRSKSTANAFPKIVFEFDEEGVDMANRLRNQSMIISGVRTMAELEKLKNQAADTMASGGSFLDFIQTASLAGFEPENPYHLRTEYDTARIAAYAAGKWDDIQSNKDIFPYLRYITMRDELVREEHAILDGTVAAVDDAFWAENYPPNGWNCRCDVEELTEDEAQQDPMYERRYPEIDIEPAFRGNIGKSRELPSDALAQYEEYIDRILAALSDAPAQVLKLSEGRYFTDVMGYPIDTAGKDNAKDALSAPNEIWQAKGEAYYIRAGEKVKVVRVAAGIVQDVIIYDMYLNQGREGYLEYGT